MEIAVERRRAPRAKFKIPVSLLIDDRETTGVGCDVSETGMLLVPATRVAVVCGQRLRLRFTLPMLVRWINAEARVVRVGKHRGLGLRLLGVDPVDRRAIRTYVFTGSAEVREYVPSRLSAFDA